MTCASRLGQSTECGYPETKYAPCMRLFSSIEWTSVSTIVFLRRKREQLPLLREIDDAVGLGEAPCYADQKTHLRHQADLGLIILEDVRRCRMELLAAHGDVAADKDAVPGIPHIVEIKNRVILSSKRLAN